ncbi:hypothetical protein [Rhizobium sp. BR 314]|uniref:hypothetical protein n=1 Tax=Rhizobium sp. BR 314 TaxID=3040013 RepID=UPI0039BF9717
MLKPGVMQLWRPLPAEDYRAEFAGALVRTVDVGAQFMVSGALDKAAGIAGVCSEGAGALGLVTGTRFSLRLARERLLIVSDNAEALVPGWHDDGYAVTSMSGALVAFEIGGQGAIEIVKRATALPLTEPGRSAAVSFAGANVYLYRFGDESTIRLHIDRGLAGYLWQWFEELGRLTPIEAGRA